MLRSTHACGGQQTKQREHQHMLSQRSVRKGGGGSRRLSGSSRVSLDSTIRRAGLCALNSPHHHPHSPHFRWTSSLSTGSRLRMEGEERQKIVKTCNGGGQDAWRGRGAILAAPVTSRVLGPLSHACHAKKERPNSRVRYFRIGPTMVKLVHRYGP